MVDTVDQEIEPVTHRRECGDNRLAQPEISNDASGILLDQLGWMEHKKVDDVLDQRPEEQPAPARTTGSSWDAE
jgi:hypothetical protein